MTIACEIDEPLESTRPSAERAARKASEGVLFLYSELLGRVTVQAETGSTTFEGPIGDILFTLAILGHAAVERADLFQRGIDWTGEQIRLRVETSRVAWLSSSHQRRELPCDPEQLVRDVDDCVMELVAQAQRDAPWLLEVPFFREAQRLGRTPTRY